MAARATAPCPKPEKHVRRIELGYALYLPVAEANAQKGTRPRVGLENFPSPPPPFSMASVITADVPADANSSHSTHISPELVRTIEAGSSRPCRPRAGASTSTTTFGAGRIPSSVLINAPLALMLFTQPRHLQPLSLDCIHLSRTGKLVKNRRPQRCSIDLSLESGPCLWCVGLCHAAIRSSPYTAIHCGTAKRAARKTALSAQSRTSGTHFSQWHLSSNEPGIGARVGRPLSQY